MTRPDPKSAPLCECGCGEQVWSQKCGVWSRWRPGHNRRSLRLFDIEVFTAPDGEAGIRITPRNDGQQLRLFE